jgi:hypothetical protein
MFIKEFCTKGSYRCRVTVLFNMKKLYCKEILVSFSLGKKYICGKSRINSAGFLLCKSGRVNPAVLAMEFLVY